MLLKIEISYKLKLFLENYKVLNKLNIFLNKLNSFKIYLLSFIILVPKVVRCAGDQQLEISDLNAIKNELHSLKILAEQTNGRCEQLYKK